VRTIDEAGGKIHPPPLAARELLDEAVAELDPVEARQQLVGNCGLGCVWLFRSWSVNL
jgi:hypothetical protein